MAKNQQRHDIMKKMVAKFAWHISDHNIQAWDNRYRVIEIVRFNDLPAHYLKRLGISTNTR